jgi:hypothetical protein
MLEEVSKWVDQKTEANRRVYLEAGEGLWSLGFLAYSTNGISYCVKDVKWKGEEVSCNTDA